MTRFALAALCALTLADAVQAQDRQRISKPPSTKSPSKGTPKPAPPPKPAAAPIPTVQLPPVAPAKLAEDTFRIGSVGLTMHLPADVLVQTTGTGDLTATQIMAKDKTWLINIKTPVTKTTKRSDEVAAEVRDQLLAMSSPIEKDRNQPLKNGATQARMLQDLGPLSVTTEQPDQARPATRFYLQMPRGEKDTAVVRGYTVFEVGPGRYVTFDLTAPEQMFSTARAAYETCIQSVRFADTKALEADRASAIDVGVVLVNGLSGADYDGACTAMKDQWYRLSRPQVGGDDQEIGYRRVRAWKGKRGEIDTARDSKQWSVEDRQEGYLVRIDARLLQGDNIIDSVGTYFMTADRREEAWLLQTVLREPGSRKPATWRELGARSGSSMSVSTDGSGESRVSRPTVPEVGYLNQVEAFLLPQLVLRPGQGGGSFGFYAYRSRPNRVCLRRDTAAATTDGGWTITTRLEEDGEPQTSTYGSGGALVRTVTPEGGVWTPITLQHLNEIWTAKHLPTR